MELTDKRGLARLQRPDIDGGSRNWGNHLFALERVAHELFGRGVLVLHQELDLGVGGDADFSGFKFGFPNDQTVFPISGKSSKRSQWE